MEFGLRGVLAARGTPYSSEGQVAALRDAVRSARQTFDVETDEGADDSEQPPSSGTVYAAERTPEDQPTTEERRQKSQSGFRLHPYLGYARSSLDDELTRTLRRPDADRLVVIVGGSVAAEFSNHAHKLLAESPVFRDNGLKPLPLAVAGYKQPQQLHLIAHLFTLGIRPAMVINIDGFNEVALGSANAATGVAPSNPSAGHWMTLATATNHDPTTLTAAAEVLSLVEQLDSELDRAKAWGLLDSAIFGRWVLDRVRVLDRDLRDARARFLDLTQKDGIPEHLRGTSRPGSEPLVDAVQVWANASRAIRALCEANGTTYVHVLQPTLHDEGSKPLTDRERADGNLPLSWSSGAARGYPILRAAGARLSEEGLLFLDASMVFAATEADLYYDGCHFNLAGNRILADAISAFVVGGLEAGRIADFAVAGPQARQARGTTSRTRRAGLRPAQASRW